MNRNPTELHYAISKLRAHYPEWRLGQLLSNVAGWADENVWDIEDDRFLVAINDHLRALAQRKQEART
jgi:hypothetical protein